MPTGKVVAQALACTFFKAPRKLAVPVCIIACTQDKLASVACSRHLAKQYSVTCVCLRLAAFGRLRVLCAHLVLIRATQTAAHLRRCHEHATAGHDVTADDPQWVASVIADFVGKAAAERAPDACAEA
jgi:hypothetical protein